MAIASEECVTKQLFGTRYDWIRQRNGRVLPATGD